VPESQREIVFTRVAFLELKDEQRLAKEGYELLDEKRILLAARIRSELRALRELRARSLRDERTACTALQAAVVRHGFDELEVYPPLSAEADAVQLHRTRLLGLELITARLRQAAPKAEERPANPSPEARTCGLAYRAWMMTLVELAACQVSLRRLVREYTRTERRARAIENVLLPEIESVLKLIEEQLESLDQEEIARRRQPARAGLHDSQDRAPRERGTR